MPILGAHQSIAGGYYKSAEIAAQCGCECVQLFTKNNNQWRAKEITDDEAERFKAALKAANLAHPLSHDSYLINLAAPDDELWKKSIDAFVIELRRAEQLGIPCVVTHPGSFTSSSEEAGLKRIIAGLDEAHAQTAGLKACTLLENTAGQGSNLGWRFEHLATILDGLREPDRAAVCIDTCHLFAAGYSFNTPQEYKAMFAEFDKLIGVKRIRAFHLNDSKRELGSRVDRHEHIGQGHVGLDGFRLLLNDPRFKKIPMYLETPKEADGESRGLELDRMNLATLRGLVEK